MDIGSILLILGILFLVSLYISQPFTRKQATLITDEEHEYSALLADRDRILKTLQDLDFDYTLGKIPEERYPAERASLLQQGASVLRKLDNYREVNGPDAQNTQLEVELKSGEGKTVSAQPRDISDDELETMIANRLRAREEKSNGFCPQCGHAVQASDRFCPRCGHLLKENVSG